MISKSKIIAYFVLILTSYLLLACSKDIERENPAEFAYINMSLSRSPQTDGNQYSIEESRIRRVRVYVFEGERLESILYTTFPDGYDGLSNIVGMPGVDISFSPIKVRVGTKNVYAVINEPETTEAQNILRNVSTPSDLNNLEYELLKFVSFGGADRYCLPMFAEQTKIKVTHSLESSPINLQLQVKRALARVDVYIRKKSDIQYYIGLTPSSYLDITNSRLTGFYSPSIIPNDGLETMYSAFQFSSKEIGYDYQLLCSFYTPERLCNTISSKLGFKIARVNNNGVVKDYSTLIGDNSNNVGGIQNVTLNKIERNCAYQIKCTFSRNTLYVESIESSIKDWEWGGELE